MLSWKSCSDDPMNTRIVHLLAGMSLHGDQHLAEVERDLVQMDVLLNEAVKKLCTSFMAIHQAIDLQQEALRSLLPGGMPEPGQAARLDALRGEIGRHVGAAVTGLQFQDMTSQLIGRMVQHLAGLRDVFGVLGTSEPADLPESGSDEMLAMLNRLSDQIGARGDERAGATARSTVNQRHMESGGIELF